MEILQTFAIYILWEFQGLLEAHIEDNFEKVRGNAII